MRIGIITPLWERGLSYTALNFYHALSEKHEMGMLTYPSNIKKQFRLNLRNEFDVPGLCVYPKSEILHEDLKRWMKPYNIILFMEERLGDWLKAAKDAGKKTVNYICEAMSPRENDMAREFDLVIAPRKIDNAVPIKLGVDIDFFKPKELTEEDKKKRKKVRVFAPMGWGGDYDRRNNDAITKALTRVQCRDKTEILIHRQGPLEVVVDHMVRHATSIFGRVEMRDTYQESDICVYCPKWERNDLTKMEAMACGLPVVGCVPKNKAESYDGVYEKAAIPDVHLLSVAIAETSEGDLEKQKREARDMAVELYDWGKNKQEFLKLMGDL